jgi:hypothetical protein
MGYGKLGLVHIQMQDLRLKWAILIGRAKNKTSGRLQYGEYLKKRLTERAKNRILFDKYINIKIQFIQE